MPPSNHYILVVEDSENGDRAGQLAPLLDQPYLLTMSGAEVVDYLVEKTRSEGRYIERLPAAVLLDLDTTGRAGIEVLSRIRGSRSVHPLPVIVLTSSSDTLDLAQAYEAGATSYVLKPADYEDLADLLEQVMQYWLRLNIPPPDWQDVE